MEISKDESAELTTAHIQGKHAVYLIGNSKNSDALIKYTYKLNLAGGKKVVDKGARLSIESSTGWNYKYTPPKKLQHSER